MNRKPISPNNKPYNPKSHHQHHRTAASLLSAKLLIILLATCATLFVLFQIQSLHHTPESLLLSLKSSSQTQFSWHLMHQFQDAVSAAPTNQSCSTTATAANDNAASTAKLRRSVTFLPLKDLRYSQTAQEGHTWFMSSMYDKQGVEGGVQYQQFPSSSSNGRLLCIKGHDTHDGAWNSYALAWPETLPENATLLKGLTFVSNNHYNYDNIWHGLSSMVPFVAWHIQNGCRKLPNRWVLYHWGELRTQMSPWLRTLMEATFDGSIDLEDFGGNGGGSGGGNEEDAPACFEEAVVMRHNEGGMSRQKRVEVYDLMRCKARLSCNTGGDGGGDRPEIGMTMFMRTGPRSFKNDSIVIGIFDRECKKVQGCKLMVAYSNNLTFCEQVKLMSKTDILISPHGAQLTNMFLMDRNSSVMEFFPKGWLKLAGVGQFVYHWIASWSGMNHRGAWRDSDGDPCPLPEDDRRCMSVYKNGRIGYNETYFSEWARNVLNEVKSRKLEELSRRKSTSGDGCSCS